MNLNAKLNSMLQIVLLFILGFSLILIDLINSAYNHLLDVIPQTVLQRTRAIDDMLLTHENVMTEITLGAISTWLVIV